MTISVSNPHDAGAQVILRPVRSEDVALITNSWLTSYRDSCHVWGVPDRSYYWCEHKILEKLIPRSAVVVACLEEDPNVILGWVAYEIAEGGVMVIHYMYVKKPFRALKIATKLFQEVWKIEQEPGVVIFTARTKHSWGIYNDKLKDMNRPLWVYNPYLRYDEFNTWSLDVDLLRKVEDE